MTEKHTVARIHMVGPHQTIMVWAGHTGIELTWKELLTIIKHPALDGKDFKLRAWEDAAIEVREEASAEVHELRSEIRRYQEALAPFAPGPQNVLAPLFGIKRDPTKCWCGKAKNHDGLHDKVGFSEQELRESPMLGRMGQGRKKHD